MPDLLVVDERGGANVTVLRYLALFNPTVLSATFGTALAAGDDAHAVRNQLFRLSATVLYLSTWEGLYKSTDSGATFVLNKVFTLQAGTTDKRLCNTGIQLAFDNGTNTLYLCGVRLNSADAMVGWRLNLDSDVLEETTRVGVIPTPFAVADSELFNNVLHFIVGDGAAANVLASWDPINQSFGAYAAPYAVGSGNALSVLDDGNLYLMGKNQAAGFSQIARFSGTWTNLANVSAHGAVVIAGLTEQRPALFTDPTTGDAVALSLIENGSTVGWEVTRIPAPYDMTGATTLQGTVLAGHPALLTAGDGGSASNVGDKRCLALIDTQTIPGTTRVILAFADNSSPGTPLSFYLWNGFGAALTLLGVGGNVHNGISTPTNGGSRFYAPGQLSVRMIDPVRDEVIGGQRLHFIASGGGNHTVRFRRAKNGQDADGAAAKLIAPVVGGGSLGTNEVTGHPFDGVTPGSVIWDLANDTPAFAAGEANTVIVPEWSV